MKKPNNSPELNKIISFKQQKININKERYLIPELIFKPSLNNIKSEGLIECIKTSI